MKVSEKKYEELMAHVVEWKVGEGVGQSEVIGDTACLICASDSTLIHSVFIPKILHAF